MRHFLLGLVCAAGLAAASAPASAKVIAIGLTVDSVVTERSGGSLISLGEDINTVMKMPLSDAESVGGTPTPLNVDTTVFLGSFSVGSLFPVTLQINHGTDPTTSMPTTGITEYIDGTNVAGLGTLNLSFNSISGLDGGLSKAGFSSTCAFGCTGSFDLFTGAYEETGQLDVTSVSVTTFSIPEPYTWTLMVIGSFGVGAMLRRQRRVFLAA